MPRANTVLNQAMFITLHHRRYKREFLFNFLRDRRRGMRANAIRPCESRYKFTNIRTAISLNSRTLFRISENCL